MWYSICVCLSLITKVNLKMSHVCFLWVDTEWDGKNPLLPISCKNKQQDEHTKINTVIWGEGIIYRTIYLQRRVLMFLYFYIWNLECVLLRRVVCGCGKSRLGVVEEFLLTSEQQNKNKWEYLGSLIISL